MKLKKLAIVIAVDEQNGIGKNGGLAWNIKEDMDFFRTLTSTTQRNHRKNAVIMGRKTWESIPEKFRPLPGRINCVLSSAYSQNPTEIGENTFGFGDFEDCHIFLSKRVDVENIFVIGGSYLYNLVLDYRYLDTIYITKVGGDFSCDTFFSPIPERFSITQTGEKKTQGEIHYQMFVYTSKQDRFGFLKDISFERVWKYKKVFFYIGALFVALLLILMSFSFFGEAKVSSSKSPTTPAVVPEEKASDITIPEVSELVGEKLKEETTSSGETSEILTEEKMNEVNITSFPRKTQEDKNIIFYYPEISQESVKKEISIYLEQKTLDFKILSFNEKNAGNESKWKIDYEEKEESILFFEYKNDEKIGEKEIFIR